MIFPLYKKGEGYSRKNNTYEGNKDTIKVGNLEAPIISPINDMETI